MRKVLVYNLPREGMPIQPVDTSNSSINSWLLKASFWYNPQHYDPSMLCFLLDLSIAGASQASPCRSATHHFTKQMTPNDTRQSHGHLLSCTLRYTLPAITADCSVLLCIRLPPSGDIVAAASPLPLRQCSKPSCAAQRHALLGRAEVRPQSCEAGSLACSS